MPDTPKPKPPARPSLLSEADRRQIKQEAEMRRQQPEPRS